MLSGFSYYKGTNPTKGPESLGADLELVATPAV